MVFGMSELQNLIMGYLYSLKDTPQSPPDPRLSVVLIGKKLDMTQREVRKATKGLIKRRYVGYFITERRRHYYLLPPGIREIEKTLEKRSEWEVSTEKIGLKKEKREAV